MLVIFISFLSVVIVNFSNVILLIIECLNAEIKH